MNDLSQSIKQAQILIVEDIQVMRLLTARHLRQSGFENIAEVEDGQAALDHIEQNPVDLVLLDIMMPVKDGYETLQELKESGKLDSLAVVMLTSVDEIESVARCIELGAVDYMPKLFNPILLNARMGLSLELLFMRRRLQELGELTG